MIPKTIHYCWFGGNPLPKSAIKCIESWKRHLPGYKIKRWDESNFDINAIPYIRQAYEQKKYAFVSDYARFKILYEEGGIYFDTDVELIRSIDDIIAEGNYMGIEKSFATSSGTSINSRHKIGVNPGLGLGIQAGAKVIREILDYYESLGNFSIAQGTIVTITSNILRTYGLIDCDTRQILAEIIIYPSDYFCPLDSTTGILKITENTRSIHHYTCSWIDHNTFRFRLHQLKNALIRTFGARTIQPIIGLLRIK